MIINNRKQNRPVFLSLKKLKNENLIFAVSYSETGKTEIYTDFLKYFEIEKPQNKSIEIKKISLIQKGKIKNDFTKKQSLKILKILNIYNKKIIK